MNVTPRSLDGVERPVEDFHPRVQLKKSVQAQVTTLGDMDSVENFSAKYIVDKKYVVSALEHLQLIELKKKKKQQEIFFKKIVSSNTRISHGVNMLRKAN